MAASGSFVSVIIVPVAATAMISTSENSEPHQCDSADTVEAEDWKQESCPLTDTTNSDFTRNFIPPFADVRTVEICSYCVNIVTFATPKRLKTIYLIV